MQNVKHAKIQQIIFKKSVSLAKKVYVHVVQYVVLIVNSSNCEHFSVKVPFLYHKVKIDKKYFTRANTLLIYFQSFNAILGFLTFIPCKISTLIQSTTLTTAVYKFEF